MHQPHGALRGVASDIVLHADQFARMRRLMAERLAFHTGQPVERIHADIERDRILTADEAVAYGIADNVITSRKLSR